MVQIPPCSAYPTLLVCLLPCSPCTQGDSSADSEHYPHILYLHLCVFMLSAFMTCTVRPQIITDTNALGTTHTFIIKHKEPQI